MQNKNKEIAFWGASPPPIGGMSVHIKILSFFLRKNGWDVIQYNFKTSKRNEFYILNVNNLILWYFMLWLKKSPKTHYIISSSTYVRFLGSLLSLRGKKIIIRVGGRSLENALNGNFLERTLTIFSLKLCAGFIGVNADICKLAEKYNIDAKVNHIPGFIPPHEQANPPFEIKNFFSENGYLKIIITGQIVDENHEDIL